MVPVKANKQQIVILSVTISTLIAVIVYFIFRKDQSIPDIFFVFEMMAHYALFYAGLICLILRILASLKINLPYLEAIGLPNGKIYISIGTINTWLGLLAMTLFIIDHYNRYVIDIMLPNLIVGILMMGDTFLISEL